MVLLKETPIALVAAILLYRVLLTRPRTRSELASTLKYAAPLAAIGAFILLQRLTTGHFFSIYDYEFDLFVLSAQAVRRQFELVTEWIFVNQLRWVLSLFIAADLLWSLWRRELHLRRDQWLVCLIIASSGYSFSVLYFLPRYLMPAFPFLFLLGAHALLKWVPRRARGLAGAIVVVVSIWSTASQPFMGNSEFNLRYLDAVAVHQEMARYIEASHPSDKVWTEFPHTVELRRPLMGYVGRPLSVARLRPGSDEIGPSDLILVSTLSGGPKMIERFAGDERFRLIKRIQRDRVTAALYGPGEPD
jgi:hypothetical protein